MGLYRMCAIAAQYIAITHEAGPKKQALILTVFSRVCLDLVVSPLEYWENVYVFSSQAGGD